MIQTIECTVIVELFNCKTNAEPKMQCSAIWSILKQNLTISVSVVVTLYTCVAVITRGSGAKFTDCTDFERPEEADISTVVQFYSLTVKLDCNILYSKSK